MGCEDCKCDKEVKDNFKELQDKFKSLQDEFKVLQGKLKTIQDEAIWYRYPNDIPKNGDYLAILKIGKFEAYVDTLTWRDGWLNFNFDKNNDILYYQELGVLPIKVLI